ncbi:MAG: PriCT-2 domain-containing protein [Verrucomicrobia bacterium]|nr:PriCT-2 domain-containing protein [Cytophagales bacterium]
MVSLSFYAHAADTVERGPVADVEFFEDVRQGRWQDLVVGLRTCAAEDKDKCKKKLPAITPSGTFRQRNDAGLIRHSGLLVLDLDKNNFEEEGAVHTLVQAKELLQADPYCYALFTSCSGRGLCMFVRIEADPQKHKAYFEAMYEYMLSRYRLFIDLSGKNLSRLRFVSYDPDLYVNPDAPVVPVRLLPKKEKKMPATAGLYFGEKDLDFVFDEILRTGTDITGDYQDWLRIAFAIAGHYGENGRERFHAVSQFSDKYDRSTADKKYTNVLRTAHQKISVATFLWYCKQNHIALHRPVSQKVIRSARMGKTHASPEGVLESLLKLDDLPPDEVENARQLIAQVFADPAENGDTPKSRSNTELIEYFLTHHATALRKSELNGELYEGNTRLSDDDIAEWWRKCCMRSGKDIPYDIWEKMLKSRLIPTFHPLREFLVKHTHRQPTGNIRRLAQSLNAWQPLSFVEHFLQKWLVGLVGGAFGKPGDYMLVLSGRQFSGKSFFFAHLLPPGLPGSYCSHTVFKGGSREKDDILQMISQWLLVDEEFESLNRGNAGAETLKRYITASAFSFRQPYARRTNTHNRLCAFAACTNHDDILTDTTGNRRYCVLKIREDIDWEGYNSIDKLDLLMEAYHLYQQDYAYTLSKEDVSQLMQNADLFRRPSTTEELILYYFRRPAEGEKGEWRRAIEIARYISIYSNLKHELSAQEVGRMMTACGFRAKKKRFGSSVLAVFELICQHKDQPFSQ